MRRNIYRILLSLISVFYSLSVWGQSTITIQQPVLSTPINCFLGKDGNVVVTIDTTGGDIALPFSYRLIKIAGTNYDGCPSLASLTIVSNALTVTFTGVCAGLHVVTVRDASGVEDPNPPSVFVAPRTVVNTTLNGPVTNVLCNGATTGAIRVRGSGGTNSVYDFRLTGPSFPSGSAFVGNGTNAHTFNGLLAGTYSIVARDANGCIDPTPLEDVTITQPNALSSDFTVSPTTVCTGNPITVTYGGSGGVATYNWSFDGGVSLPGTGAGPHTLTYATAGTKTITLQVIDNAGCVSSTTSRTITVNETPVLTITNPAAVCTPATIDLTAAGITAGSTGGGTLTYWTDAAATSALSSPNAIATSGTYYIKSTTTAGCSDTKPVMVTINPTPVLTITNPAAVCTPATVNLTAAAVTAGSTGSGTLTYWADAAATTALSNPSAVATSGTYYIKNTTGAGCTDIKPVTVTINTSPALIMTNPPAVCSPATVDLTAISVTAGSTGNGALTYWTDAAATIALSNPNAVAASGTYYIKSTVATGCTDVKPVTVIINPTPVLAITNPVAVCTSATVDLTSAAVTAGSTGGGALSYWIDAAATNALVSPSAVALSGTYYIKSTSAAGCTDIKPVTVTVNPSPALVITNPASACAPATVDLTSAAVTVGSTGSGTLSYWTDAAATLALSNPSAVSTTGTYYIKSTTASGCTDIKPVTVTVNPSPALVITNSAAVCAPATVDLTSASVTAGSTGNGTLTYWTNAAATLALSSPNAVTVSGVYYIKSTNGAGCMDVKPVTVTVNPSPVLVITNPAAVCAPATVNLTLPSVIAGSTNGTSLTYWTDAAATIALSNPNAVATSGTYYIKSTNASGCADTKPVTGTINPTPVLTITNPAAVCSPATVNLTLAAVTAGSTGGGMLSYWTDAAATLALSNPSTVATSGTYYIKSKVATGCTDIKPVTVTVNPSPVLVITNPAAVCSPATVNLTDAAVTAGSTGSGTISYWTDAAATLALINPSTVNTSGTYYIRSTSTAGCTDIKPVIVTINPTPVLVITNPSAVCAPASLDLTAAAITAGSSGGGTLSYWTDAAASNALASPTAVTASGTYYIKSTTAGGCTDIKPVVVTINPAVAAPTVAAIVYCQNDAANALTATGTNLLWYTAATGGTGSASVPVPLTTASGSFDFFVSQTVNGCESPRAVLTVTVRPSPVLSITNPAAVCSPATVDLTAAAVTVGSASGTLSYWTNAAATAALSNPAVIAASGTYFIKITDSNGCSTVRAVAVTINATPVATFAYSGSPYCISNANLSPTLGAGAVAGTFTASASGLVINAATGEINLSASQPGSYTVTNTVTATGSGGCSAIATTTVFIELGLTAGVSIAASATTACAGTAITFTATPTNGGSAPTYQWRVNGVNVNGATNATFTSSTLSNNDQVSVVMSAGGTGCITGSPATSNAVGITISNSLTASVSITADQTTVCAGTAITFTATPTNGGSIPTYQWKVNGVDVNGATNPTFTSSTLTNNDQVSVVMTAGGTGTGCITGSPATSNAVGITISNNLTASVSISASATTVCAGTAVTFTATSTNGGSAPIYQWRVNGVDVTGANATTFTSSTLANNDQVSVLMTAGGTGTGCISGSPATSNAVGITLSNSLAASVSITANQTTVCAGTAVTFTATPTNGGSAPTYQWRINGVNVNGATSPTFTSSTLSNNDQVSVVMTAGGTGTGCISGRPTTSNAVGITISNSLTATVSISASATTVCSNTAVTFTATSTNGGSAPTYQWRINGVDVTGANAATFTSSTLANNDQVSVVMTAGGTGIGCITGSPATSNNVGITISNSLTASVNISASATTVCAGTAITFTATPTNGGSTPTYQWLINGLSAGANGSTFTSSTLTNNDKVSVIMTAGGTGISCITGSPATSNQINITISNGLTAGVSIGASQTTVCTGAAITFTATPTNGGSAPTYQWKVNGVDVNGATNATFISSTLSNNDQVSVVMTAGGTGTGCILGSPATSNAVVITISSSLNAGVSITASANGPFCVGSSIQFTATPSNGGSAPTYQWRVNGVNVNGANRATFTSSTLNNNDQVSVVMTPDVSGANSCVNPDAATSNQLVVSVKPASDPSCACNLVAKASSNPVTCQGDANGEAIALVLSGGSGQYLYSLNGGTPVSLDQIFSVFRNQPFGAFSIKITDRNNTNCTTTVNENIGALVKLVAQVNGTDPTCRGNDGKIEFAPFQTGNGGGTAPYQISINGGATFTQTATGAITFSNLTVGTYNVVISDGTPCTTSFAIKLNAAATQIIPTVSISTPSPTVCTGQPVTFTSSITNGGNAPRYQWQVNGVNVNGATNATFTSSTLTSADQVTVVMTPDQSGAGSCINPAPVTSNRLSITPSNRLTPSVTIATPNSSVCSGAAVTFTATPANGGTSPAYQWRVNGVNVAGANTAVFTSSTLTGTDVVTVVMSPDVTGAGSCIQSGAVTSNGLSITISNSIAPSVSIATLTSQVCVGSAVTFTATVGNGGNSPSLQWKVNGVNVANATTTTFTTSTLTSSDVVTVVMTPDQSGGNTCINPAPVTSNSLSVTVSSSLTASVNVSASSTSICAGGMVTFTATATNGGSAPTYQWRVNGVNVAGATTATFSGNNLNNNDQVSVVMRPDISGSNSCVNPGSVNSNNVAVTVRPASDPGCNCNLTVAAQTTNVTCRGGNDGNATLFIVSGGSASSTYEYKVGNGAFQSTPNFTGLAEGSYTFTVRDLSTSCQATTTINLAPRFTVSAVIVVNQPRTCGDRGSIQFTNLSGGTAPYQVSVDSLNFSSYPANDLFANLEPGTYKATIKDANNCVFSRRINIVGAAPIIANLSKTDVSCNGGSNGVVTISNPSGGANNGYVYSMDGTSYSGTTSFSGLRAGNYTFYVKDASGTCLQSFLVTMNEPAPIQVTASATQPASCQAADGQISAMVNSGGMAPFEYRLNNGTFQTASSFTALGNGSYTLTVRDANGCQATRQVSLTSVGAISATATVLSGASCNRADGSAQLTNITGGSGSYEYSKDGISYQDSPLFQNLRGGNYLLIVRDKATTNRCTATYPVTISEPLQVVATVTVTRVPANCQASDGEIKVSNVSGGQPAYQYSLDSLINFQNSPVFAGLRNGNYKVYVRDLKGCYGIYSATLASPDAIRVGNAVSVVAPSCGGVQDGRINLNTNGSNVTGGQPGYLYSLNGGAFQTASLFSGLAAGAYQVKVKDQAGCELTFNYTLTNPAGISFDVVQTTSAGCGGEAGAVEVKNVSGGTAPYSYSTNGVDFQSASTFANLASGAYTMYVRDASLQTACINRKAFNVLGSTTVRFAVSKTDIGCEGGEKGQITINNIVGGIPATGTARYQVSINGGQSFRDVTGGSLVFDNLRPGNYEVIMTYGENLGCSTPARQVTITSAGAFFEVGTTAATCGEANGRAEAVVPNASAGYSYSLEPNTGFRPSPVFTNLKPGVYTMYIRTGAVETCPNQRAFTIPGPDKLTYKFKKNNRCEGDECQDSREGTVAFTEIKGGVLPYKVSVDNGANFTFDVYQDNFLVTGLRPGDYQIIVADATGCRTLPVPVKIEESRTRARLRVEPSLPDEPTGKVWVQDIRGGTPTYEVSIDGLTWAPVRSPKLDTVITGIAVGRYRLFIRDANGCIKCFNFNVEESKFTIPNIFTPNADTYNDTFRIRNLPDGSLLSIVNRWGKIVYQNSNYQNDWDGGTLPDAVYYYTLNVPGKGVFTGWVEVRRSE